jgi:F-type H+-transporting ATPase subunit delta
MFPLEAFFQIVQKRGWWEMLSRQGVMRSGLRVWATAQPMFSRSFAEAAATSSSEKREKVFGEAQVTEKFKADWKTIAPNFDMPKFPSNFMEVRPPVPSTIPAKLTVNFVLPSQYEIQAKQVTYRESLREIY